MRQGAPLIVPLGLALGWGEPPEPPFFGVICVTIHSGC